MVGGLNTEIRLQIFERRGSRRQAEVTKSVSALRVRERARARPLSRAFPVFGAAASAAPPLTGSDSSRLWVSVVGLKVDGLLAAADRERAR